MKSYTDLEQSQKLAKFLPLESADGTWSDSGLPCWNLAALMSVFPKEEGSCTSLSFGYYDANGNHINSWLCCYEKEGESTDDYIIETISADNPIDCCYEMILKLKEKGLL